jgi:hypothetical protein
MRRRLQIDFLFLDLTTCARCRGTGRSLESALLLVREVLEATGIEVEVNQVQVESARQARELRFESSPTIRVNGRDVALELRESRCGEGTCTDGCGGQIDCRVWVHDGREHTVAPVAMIVDAILRVIYGGPPVGDGVEAEPYELPANLERFFAGTTAEPREIASCCSPAELRTCCEPEDKADCCGTSAGEGCGCR